MLEKFIIEVFKTRDLVHPINQNNMCWVLFYKCNIYLKPIPVKNKVCMAEVNDSSKSKTTGGIKLNITLNTT